ncbi:neutrophil cytosol factor 2 isoform X2 [Callorhinchus milii]|nr:neutrophil cytosol factor 2 isoform X2 [Callorhinchus milii]|eukprot:gi/632956020/ref/XP_007893753.1/ PREDICTED: neutrophil cytosol factor 2 isoform X2 [Callorhinchus milii]
MSICKDEHLAVAFYQRGITFFKTENYEEAIRDFKEAFHQLRGNLLIDYHQLGLRYKLFACEVLHNQALAHAQLQTWTEAEEVLKNALGFKTEPKHNFVDEALGAVRNQKLFELLQLPRGQLFRPKKNKVAELEKQDFLGEAKVVASIVDNDEFSGFAPLQPLVPETVSKTKPPEILKSLQGELYRVLFNFIPKNEQELRVQSGNIVSVLEKGDDSWATVMFNNKFGLVPSNYLEQLEPAKEQKSPPPQIPAPPTTVAPEKTSLKVTGENQFAGRSHQPGEPARKVQHTEQPIPKPSIVKVHFKYTVVLRVKPGITHIELQAAICKKFKLTECIFGLSYKASDELIPITSETKMKSAWSQSNNGRLTIWCKYLKVMALYDYETSEPGDLLFQEGDIIHVLAQVNQDWLEGQCKENIGIFPSIFVKQLNMDNISDANI